MLTIEYILLGLTYSSLVIAVFLQFLCFQRKIEHWETIAFTISLLFLVVSISSSPLQPDSETTALSTLLCMLLISITTVLDTLSKQVHSIPNKVKWIHLSIALALGLSAIFTFQSRGINLIQNLIVGFLVVSVVGAMLFVQKTKSLKQFGHDEKSSKTFAWTFIIIVPIYMMLHFVMDSSSQIVRLDFMLYLAFLCLAVAKVYDDLKRLSLLKRKQAPNEQQFQNYGLTKREQEIARLLFDGLTYQTIANQLFISMPTVKTHASNIYKKCKVSNRHQLTKLMID